MPRGPSGSTRLSDEREWTSKSLKGEYPLLSSMNATVEDEQNKRIFFYGGIAPGDKGSNPTSDFHVCDTEKMTVKNITVCYFFFQLIVMR
jgi:hypothetical protein